jgi:hypothetical protein
MLHRIDVTILDVAGIIDLIPDQMFPEPPLPDATLVTRSAHGADALMLRQLPRESLLDQPPAQ